MTTLDIENNHKKLTDNMASALLGLDSSITRIMATEVSKILPENPRIVVCGAAGSGKTSFAEQLGELLDISVFDLDEFIPGGHTEDRKEYKDRLDAAWVSVWNKLPNEHGWIVEHVEACHPEFLELSEPNFAILLDPGKDHLLEVAKARDAINNNTDGSRKDRAIKSSHIAKSLFDSLPGRIIKNKGTLIVKKIA